MPGSTIDKFYSAYNDRNPEVLRTIAHDEYRVYDNAASYSLQEHIDFIKRFIDVVPNFRFEMQDEIASGDKIVRRWIGRGKLEKEFFGIPPGHSFAVNGVGVFRLAEGKIIEGWTVWDQASFVSQLTAK
jgi:predicted ester cyclase